MTQRIEEYAVFGDRGSAGFVGLDGSTNLLSIPRFDSGDVLESRAYSRATPDRA
jgi:hypothetical protein